MASNSSLSDNFTIPDGLPLNPIDPQWLTHLWPTTSMNSSLGSVMLTLAIYVGLLVAALILFLVTKALPKWWGKIVPVLVFGVGAVIAFGGYTAYGEWNTKQNINTDAMAVEVGKTAEWVNLQNISLDNRGAWDLVCTYYGDKNKYCRTINPTINYKGSIITIKLMKTENGSIQLVDAKTSSPVAAK